MKKLTRLTRRYPISISRVKVNEQPWSASPVTQSAEVKAFDHLQKATLTMMENWDFRATYVSSAVAWVDMREPWPPGRWLILHHSRTVFMHPAMVESQKRSDGELLLIPNRKP